MVLFRILFSYSLDSCVKHDNNNKFGPRKSRGMFGILENAQSSALINHIHHVHHVNECAQAAAGSSS